MPVVLPCSIRAFQVFCHAQCGERRECIYEYSHGSNNHQVRFQQHCPMPEAPPPCDQSPQERRHIPRKHPTSKHSKHLDEFYGLRLAVRQLAHKLRAPPPSDSVGIEHHLAVCRRTIRFPISGGFSGPNRVLHPGYWPNNRQKEIVFMAKLTSPTHC